MHTPGSTPWVDNRWNNLYLYLAVSFKGCKILPGWYENLWRRVGFTTIFLKGIIRWLSKYIHVDFMDVFRDTFVFFRDLQ